MLVVLIRQIIAVGPFLAVDRHNNVTLNYFKTASLELQRGEASKLMCQNIPFKCWIHYSLLQLCG